MVANGEDEGDLDFCSESKAVITMKLAVIWDRQLADKYESVESAIEVAWEDVEEEADPTKRNWPVRFPFLFLRSIRLRRS